MIYIYKELTENELDDIIKKVVKSPERELEDIIEEAMGEVKELTENELDDIIKKVVKSLECEWEDIIEEAVGEVKKDSTNNKHTAEKELIKQALERYRDEPPESNIRKGVEWLLNEHARLQGTVPEYKREQYRKRHNALVLKYIVEVRMTDNQIGKKLHSSWKTVQNMVDKGISELSSICFGYIE